MIKHIKVPKEALSYITLQRTNYFNGYLELFPKFIKNRLEILFGKTLTVRYNNDIFSDYESIKSYLPSKLVNVLDIGSGIAGIDSLLYWNHQNPNLFLLDKSQVDSNVYYGFEKKGSYYNSLELARTLLLKNGVLDSKIFLNDLSDGAPIFEENTFDLIISTISWGFHYPVSTYIDMVYRSLKPSGVLILDVRKETGGEDKLRECFSLMKVRDFGKYTRYACEKKK